MVKHSANMASGALMYGPPGTGKTLLARACAAQTDATFLKLAGPQLVQMFIGDGAKLVRDCFALAKEKAPAIIFIDELDAVGTKRFDSKKSGDREVQRTMLELLNQLDGFASDDRIKVLAATNRVDVLDPALLRSGRLDRKIEFPLPNEEARAQILKIHSRKMTVDASVNWGELARSTDEFGGAMLKAVCVEAGMIALRMGKNKISHEHYVDAIAEVQAKKKEVSLSQLPRRFLFTTNNAFRRSISMRNRETQADECPIIVGKPDGIGIDIATIDDQVFVLVRDFHEDICPRLNNRACILFQLYRSPYTLLFATPVGAPHPAGNCVSMCDYLTLCSNPKGTV